jgi:multicomponent Na+:H+ antiporter subunit A
MRWDRSLILDTGVAVVVPVALVVSVFLLFAGHNAPGGGFVGGLVAGAAFVLRYVASGVAALRPGTAIPAQVLLGGGLAVAVTTGAVPWLSGGQFLESADLVVALPLVGEVHTSSALFFDVGVYLVVVGLILAILGTLGQEVDA